MATISAQIRIFREERRGKYKKGQVVKPAPYPQTLPRGIYQISTW